MGVPTGYINSSGLDIGIPLVPKSYLIDRYPELADTFKQAGLWNWGLSIFGALGDNTTVNKSSPVQTIAGGTNWKQVSVGGSAFSAAIKTDGTLWTWGNWSGLGDNTMVNKSSPVQTIAGGTNWKQVACTASNTAAIKTDGTLWIWGANGNGEVGDNTNGTNRLSPVQTVSGGTNWKLVASGRGSTTAAIKTDGTLWLWGANSTGTLGIGGVGQVSSPVQTVSGGTNWKQVACGNNFTAAIKTDGTLWTWGNNSYGQLGNNSNNTNISSPIQTISSGTNWKQVSCGRYHTGAIKTDGTLWLWGNNSEYVFIPPSTVILSTTGRIGTNVQILNYSSPVQTVSGGTNWKLVTCGSYHTAAIKTDGTLWTWGNNGSGQLGNNSITMVSSPIQTVAGGTNWKEVAISGTTSAAIQDNSADMFGNPL